MEIEKCILCGCALNSDVVRVGPKGQKNLVLVSQRRQDNKFKSVTDESPILHSKCRAYYINEKCIKSAIKRSSSGTEHNAKENIITNACTFDYQQQCIFCAEDASEKFIKNETKKPLAKRKIVCKVLKKDTADNIFVTSLDDKNDLRKEVRARVQDKDLVKLNARYHKACYSNFLKVSSLTHFKIGRPVSEEIENKMRLVYDYIDSNMEGAQFSVEDIRRAINIELPDTKTLKRKLIQHYGENMLVQSSKGKPSLFCFVANSKQLLCEQWYTNRQTDENKEKMRIVQTAANIVLEDIRSIRFKKHFSPTPSSSLKNGEQQIPETLLTFMKTVITKYKKDSESLKSTIIALSHSIMAAARNSFPTTENIASLSSGTVGGKDINGHDNNVNIEKPESDLHKDNMDDNQDIIEPDNNFNTETLESESDLHRENMDEDQYILIIEAGNNFDVEKPESESDLHKDPETVKRRKLT